MDIDCEIDASFSSDTSEEHALCLSKEENPGINAELEVHVGPFGYAESIIETRALAETVESIICNGIFKAAGLYNDLPERRKLKTDKDTVTSQYQKLNPTQVKKLLQLGQKNEWAAVVYDADLHLPFRLTLQEAEAKSNLAKTLEQGWNRTFHGEGKEALMHVVRTICNDKDMYHNALPILQSSGSGKSRLVDEISKSHFLFPMCLRIDPETEAGYPPPDVVVRDYLGNLPTETQAKDLSSFLAALFYTAARTPELVPESGTYSTLHLVDLWYKHFAIGSSTRQDFYENVVQTARQGATQSVQTAFSSLQTQLRARTCDWKDDSMIFWALDEIQILTTAEDNHAVWKPGGNRSKLAELGSVLAEFKTGNFNFLTFFLSTTSTLFQIAPPRRFLESSRAIRPGVKLPSPFTDLTYDPFATVQPLTAGRDHDFASLPFAVALGRPLFYTLYHHDEDRLTSPGVCVERIVRLAQAKLRGTDVVTKPITDLNEEAIAVLAVRLLLEVYPYHLNARELNERLIGSHMQTAYYVPYHREYVRAGYSTEPLLAHASATIMNETIPRMDVWNLLQIFFQHGYGDQGECGELVGRTLDILAVDRAIIKLPPLPKDSLDLRFLQRVKLLDFFEQLLTDEAYEALLKFKAVNAGLYQNNFSEAFKNAWVHLSHYMRAGDSQIYSVEHGWAYYLRGAALETVHGQRVADAIQFIHMPTEEDETVNRHTMSVIIRQDKAGRQNEVIPPVVASDLGIWADAAPKAYIAIYSHVGCQPANGDVPLSPERVSPRTFPEDGDGPRFELHLYQNHYKEFVSHDGLVTPALICAKTLVNRSKYDLWDAHPWKHPIIESQFLTKKVTGDLTESNSAWYRNDDAMDLN